MANKKPVPENDIRFVFSRRKKKKKKKKKKIIIIKITSNEIEHGAAQVEIT